MTKTYLDPGIFSLVDIALCIIGASVNPAVLTKAKRRVPTMTRYAARKGFTFQDHHLVDTFTA